MIGTNLSKLFLGVGINDADYVVQIKETVGYVDGKQKRKIIWTCPFYQKWASMLSRCYSPRVQKLQPSYGGVTVCDEWLTFSNFKAWMEKQDWEGKVLDKDLIGDSQLYSEDTCLFISNRVNSFIGENMVGEFPGTSVKFNDGRVNCVVSQICGADGKLHLGVFPSQLQAHRAWQKEKINQAKILVDTENDLRVKFALIKIISKIEEDIVNGNITRRLK